MIYTPLTKKAMLLACEKHKDQVDKSGMPYILHPLHVAEKMDDEISTTVALLHDIVEDTDLTFEDLLKLEFPSEVVKVLTYLTHRKDQDYFEYVKKISENDIATKVKIADLEHNSDLTRLNKVTEEDIKRVEKYKHCIEYLKNIYNSNVDLDYKKVK